MDGMTDSTAGRRKAIIGNVNSSFWLYDSIDGFDLTHPATPTSPTVSNAVRIETTKQPIKIDPSKSALVVIDMQNFFLSPALGRSPQSKGLEAQKRLLQYAIPAARTVGMRVVWLTWGLTKEDLNHLPAATVRAFGFDSVEASQFQSHIDELVEEHSDIADKSPRGRRVVPVQLETFGKSARLYCGLGNDMGPVQLEDGSMVEAGCMLMRDQWNTALTPELYQAYQQGLQCNPPDIWIHKNRMSGFWGSTTPGTEYLEQEGMKTLFFAGVNTDQCVGGALMDAFSRGFDCILLSDGAATSSLHGQESYEFNAAGTFGFCTTCKHLWDGVEAQQG